MSYWCYHLFYMSNIATPLTDYRGTCLLTANFFSQKLRKRNLQHQVIFPKKRKLLKKINQTTLHCDCKAALSTQAVTTKFSS